METAGSRGDALMSVTEGLVKGRSHIVFICGLIAAGAMIISLERSSLLHPPVLAPLTVAQREAATVAWGAAAGTGDADRLAAALGADTSAPRSRNTPPMSAAAGRAILAALARQRSPDVSATGR